MSVPNAKRAPNDHQARAWCVTLWAEEDVYRLKATAGVVAMCSGEEIAPETGRVHFQTYVRFENNKRFSWWKNQFPTAHVEVRRGSEPDAAKYCRKDGKVLVDFGCVVESVKSGDALEQVLDMMEAGAPDWQIYKEHRRFFFLQGQRIDWLYARFFSWDEKGHPFRKGT